MAEYIERRRLFNALADYWSIPHDWDGGIAQLCEDALAFIENAPEEDVAPVVHGRWEVFDDNQPFSRDDVLRCSSCKTGRYIRPPFLYCPNCGARMDGDGNG